jgi:ABC-type bacteriocin/lantibiotic exporter with double-glycine peptidase domain
MAGTAQQSDVTQQRTRRRRGKHVHHGRTTAAWAGSIIGLIAFIVGAIAVVIQHWPLFWASVALAAVGLIATVVLQRMGYGAH